MTYKDLLEVIDLFGEQKNHYVKIYIGDSYWCANLSTTTDNDILDTNHPFLFPVDENSKHLPLSYKDFANEIRVFDEEQLYSDVTILYGYDEYYQADLFVVEDGYKMPFLAKTSHCD